MIKIRQGYWAIALGLVASVLFIACGQDTGSAESKSDDKAVELRQVEQEVLDIHDEVMPKMGDLNNNRKKLIQRLYTQDSVQYGLQIKDAVHNLEEADSLMWDWMHNYSRPNYGRDLDSVGDYLNAELVRVKVMREKFFKSLDESETLLKQLNASDE